jgi:hypothetical protein
MKQLPVATAGCGHRLMTGNPNKRKNDGASYANTKFIIFD